MNTGVATYVWILDNDKAVDRHGKVELIDGAGLWRKMSKSLWSKRRRMTRAYIDQDLTAPARRPREVDELLTKIFETTPTSGTDGAQ